MTSDDVEVSRRSLRHMRSLVGGILVGFMILATAATIELFEGYRRCEAGNRFRNEELPAAFAEYSLLLGDKLGAPPEEVEAAIAEFDAALERRFPPQSCRLL